MGTTWGCIISQLPTDQWYEAIGDNTLADAILDRLMHNAQCTPDQFKRRIHAQKNEFLDSS